MTGLTRLFYSNGTFEHGFGVARRHVANSATVLPSASKVQFEPGYG
jgi:hypothetical protein|tara:strand:- start:373 stop:510 length:138 start_codon:yes stop_codon:yes gene_type:complete